LFPDSVAVPEVVLFKPTPPARIALTVPDCTSYAVVEVSTPVVPVIEPEANCTPATVLVRLAILNVPPFTTTVEAVASTLFAPSVSVPVLTLVAPV
jgi:hypothetical protein